MSSLEKMQTHLSKKIDVPGLSLIAKYQLLHTLILAFVPFVCGFLLLLLVSIFAKLNLYYLEANGLLVDEQIRDAYFKQVEMQLGSMAWILLFLIFVTGVVAFVVMKWACAPFLTAQKIVQNAIENPEKLKPASRWLSESPQLDHFAWQFALKIKNGNNPDVKHPSLSIATFNWRFLAKFVLSFTTLSVMVGFVMGSIISSVYEKIVSIAIQFVQKKDVMTHYFVAQQEILSDATTLMIALSWIVFLLIGLQVSRYMATMTFVFSRALKDEKVALYLRSGDIYTALAGVINQGREKIFSAKR